MAEVPNDISVDEVDSGILKTGALLHTQRLTNVTRMPLMMEFPVPPTPPFLVTTTRSLAWIPAARRNRLRAGVMQIDSTATLFRAIVNETIRTGRSAQWDNVHPFTLDGLKKAIEHPRYYGLDELQLLAHPDTNWEVLNPKWKRTEGKALAAVLDLPVEPAMWMDPNTILAIPKDRGFIGFVIEIGDSHVVAVIHNAARAIGIATAASVA